MISRIKEDLIRTSAMGRVSNRPVAFYGQLDPKMGVSRPEGSSANKVLRDFTVQCMQTAGLSVRIDRVGNIFGRKAITNQPTYKNNVQYTFCFQFFSLNITET